MTRLLITGGAGSGELLTELHQTEPGVYTMTVPGCLPPMGIQVVAFNAQGRRVGSGRGRTFTAHPCNPKTWFHRRQHSVRLLFDASGSRDMQDFARNADHPVELYLAKRRVATFDCYSRQIWPLDG